MLYEKYDYFFADLLILGSDTTKFIDECSHINSNMIIIVVSAVTDPYIIKELLANNIHAFLSKSAGINEIKTAIEAISLGEKYVSTNLAGKLATHMFAKSNEKLTKKEIEVLRLVAQGFTIIEAAKTLHLSTHTIVAHRRNIMQKLGIRSATEMVKYAFENKLC